MKKHFAIGLVVSLATAIGTVAVKIATENWRTGFGDFLLFITLPEIVQERGVYALYPAKSLLAVLLFTGTYFAAKKAGKIQSAIALCTTVLILVGMCFGDVVV